jgi:hypothetical protein
MTRGHVPHNVHKIYNTAWLASQQDPFVIFLSTVGLDMTRLMVLVIVLDLRG